MNKYLVIYKKPIKISKRWDIDMRGAYVDAERIEDVKHEFRKTHMRNCVIDDIICQDSFIDVYDCSKLNKPLVARIRTSKSMEKYGNCEFIERGMKEDARRK